MSQFDAGNVFMNYRGVNNVVDDVRDQTRAIRQMMNEMNTELAKLRNSWVGEARNQYSQKQEAWDTAMLRMEELLEKDAGVLETVQHGYRRREGSLAQSWADCKIGR